jgi:hypothetical protein
VVLVLKFRRAFVCEGLEGRYVAAGMMDDIDTSNMSKGVRIVSRAAAK